MARPVSIKNNGSEGIIITWDNGHRSTYSFKFLRESCPCAACKGESVLLHKYEAPPQKLDQAGRYTLTGVQPVGSYAIQLIWADGHDTGIYSWEYLMDCCMCPECLASRESNAFGKNQQ